MMNDGEDENRSAYTNSALMSANGLLYKMPQTLSTCVNRSQKKQYAQRQSYAAGDTMGFDVNTGSSYVDPAGCMLSFDLKCTFAATPDTADRVTFGSGMATNLIQEIRILSKNGTEIDRTQNADTLAKILKDYKCSAEGEKMLVNAGHGLTMVPTVVNRFVIPMSVLSGFFRPTVKGMKIPAGLASGLRIEFIMSKANRALTKSNPTATTGSSLTYEILKPELLFACMELNDPTQAVLMKESAQSGLEYTFPSYFSTTLFDSQTTINEQVKKAVSQCTRAFCGVYNVSGSDSVVLETRDGYKSIGGSQLTNFQFRVGSNYYPQKFVDTPQEALFVTEAAFDNMRDIHNKPSNVSITEYNADGKFVVGVPLETDDRLNLSGIPLNNSNVLELRMEVANATNLTRMFQIFIEFVAVSKTFINKTSLKI